MENKIDEIDSSPSLDSGRLQGYITSLHTAIGCVIQSTAELMHNSYKSPSLHENQTIISKIITILNTTVEQIQKCLEKVQHGFVFGDSLEDYRQQIIILLKEFEKPLPPSLAIETTLEIRGKVIFLLESMLYNLVPQIPELDIKNFLGHLDASSNMLSEALKFLETQIVQLKAFVDFQPSVHKKKNTDGKTDPVIIRMHNYGTQLGRMLKIENINFLPKNPFSYLESILSESLEFLQSGHREVFYFAEYKNLLERVFAIQKSIQNFNQIYLPLEQALDENQISTLDVSQKSKLFDLWLDVIGKLDDACAIEIYGKDNYESALNKAVLNKNSVVTEPLIEFLELLVHSMKKRRYYAPKKKKNAPDTLSEMNLAQSENFFGDLDEPSSTEIFFDPSSIAA